MPDSKWKPSMGRGNRRTWRLLSLSSAMLLISRYATATERKEPSTVSSDPITRLAFGSCNKQYLPQPMWTAVEDLSPDVWLWIGDAVYVDKHSDGGVDKMREAIADQLANEDYQRFLSKVPRVEGVWDDHDYGVNDAGKELVDHPGRVEAFLDFLGAGQEDPRRGGGTLYSAHVFGEAPRKVKVLLLDIRTERDKYHLFNMSGKKFKFAAMIGAMLRWVSSSFCLGSDYDGAVIGDEQFDWLEEQLTDSDATVHVLVSTLQMLTSNPLVESWGHFPKSREKMLSLLRRTNPKGLVILSGDVHHAELASGWKRLSAYSPATSPRESPRNSEDSPAVREKRGEDVGEGSSETENLMPPGHEEMMEGGKGGRKGCPFAKSSGGATVGSGGGDASGATDAGCAAALAGGEDDDRVGRGVVEVTSSGMTHSCLSSHGERMCEAYLRNWPEHRWREDAYYLDTNFGDIEIEWADEEGAAQPKRMAVTVRDTSGIPVLPVVEYFGDEGQHRQAAEKATAEMSMSNPPATTTDSNTAEGEQSEKRNERTVQRTFLERSPPPECVELVLPAGCTAWRLSAVVVNMAALVLSCALLCGKARRPGRKRTLTVAKSEQGNRNGSRHGPGNGARNGPANRFTIDTPAS